MKEEILLKLIDRLINSGEKSQMTDFEKNDIYKKGDYVIVRSYYSGVIYGKYMGKSEDGIIMHEARRLRYWKAKNGITISSVSVNGISSESRITEPVNICITDTTVCEIIKCSDECIKTFNEQPNHQP